MGMDFRGQTRIGLLCQLALVALLVFWPASASAAQTFTVNETTDAPLNSGAITCESTNPGGGCTLRAAVELADEGAGQTTIEVPEGTYDETEGELFIEDSSEVLIRGAGAEKTDILGNGKESVFYVGDGGVLTLDALAVEEGGADEGGGVFVESGGSLTVEHSSITHNGAFLGGGVSAEEDTSVTISESQIEENEAEIGGGIFVSRSSDLTLDHATLAENASFLGGGIYAEENTPVEIGHSTIEKNLAYLAGGGLYGEWGSAVALQASKVLDNEAGVFGGGIEEGEGTECIGAVSAHASQPHPALDAGEEPAEGLAVSQSTIEGNVVREGEGGGIFIGPEDFCPETATKATQHTATKRSRSDVEVSEEEPLLTVEQSTIARNQAGYFEEGEEALGYGGGIFEESFFFDPVIDSTITENVATATGGGVAVAEGWPDLVSDTVSANTIHSIEPGEQTASALRWPVRHAMRSRSGADVIGETPDALPGGNLAANPEGDAGILLRNTIVSEPEGSNSENCGEGDVESLVPGAGYNLDFPASASNGEGVDECGMSEGDHDLVGVNAQLSGKSLQNNGGPTETIALESASPAIGVVPLQEDCEKENLGPALPNELGEAKPVDQRGEKRPGIPGKGCDIGAYEYQQPASTPETKQESKPAATGVLPIKITSPVQCASERNFVIHIQNVKAFGIVSASVSIDGKHARTLSGKRLRTGINLVGLPKGTFTVEIVAHTKSGKTLHGERVYHTCRTKLPGHPSLRL